MSQDRTESGASIDRGVVTAPDLLRKLARMRDPKEQAVRLSRWPDRVEQASTVLMVGALVSFLLLCGLAGAHAYSPLSRAGRNVALGLVVVTHLAALLSMAMRVVAGAASLWLSQQRAGEIRASRCERDLKIARWIATQEEEEVRLADKWLQQDISRIEARLSLFFGGADKVALFALVGVGWLSWREVVNASLGGFGSPPWFVMALLTGVALGGLLLRGTLRPLVFQRDLISLSTELRAAKTP